MVVPNRLFRNRDATIIREILANNTNIHEIVDFGWNEVFRDTRGGIGAIVAQKKANGPYRKDVREINVIDISSQFLLLELMNARNLG